MATYTLTTEFEAETEDEAKQESEDANSNFTSILSTTLTNEGGTEV